MKKELALISIKWREWIEECSFCCNTKIDSFVTRLPHVKFSNLSNDFPKAIMSILLHVVLALGRNLHLEAYTSLHFFPIELIRFSFDAIHRSSEFLNVSLSSSLYVRYSDAYRHGWYVSLRPWALWHYARGGGGLFCDNVYYHGIARTEKCNVTIFCITRWFTMRLVYFVNRL